MQEDKAKQQRANQLSKAGQALILPAISNRSPDLKHYSQPSTAEKGTLNSYASAPVLGINQIGQKYPGYQGQNQRYSKGGLDLKFYDNTHLDHRFRQNMRNYGQAVDPAPAS